MLSGLRNLLDKIGGWNNTTIVRQNGRTIINGNVVGGNLNVTSNGDQIIINGEVVHTTSDKNITIVVEKSDVGNITLAAGNITVEGSAKEVSTQSGEVCVKGDVLGNIRTMSGGVSAHKVVGGMKTMSGNIRITGSQ